MDRNPAEQDAVARSIAPPILPDAVPAGTPCSANPHADHEWLVFSTALRDVVLLVQCGRCGASGMVPDPTVQEWSAAFHAPSSPYPWLEGDRVRIFP